MESNSPRLISTPIRRLGLSRRSTFKSPLISRPSADRDGNTATKRLCTGFGQTTIDDAAEGNPSKIKKTDAIKTEIIQVPVISTDPNEDLVERINMWRTGFKESFLALQTCLVTQEDIHITKKQLLKQLGIWENIKVHFAGDSEIFDSDEDAEEC